MPDLSKTVNPVTVTIGETHLPVIKGERSGDMPYTEVPYKYIFQSLRVGEIVYIFNTLLSEEKVVFVSDSITKLCIFTDFMKTIMYPFKWAYTFIPILPLCLIDYLGSPTPFIIGMLTKHQRLIPKSELDSLCIVNLDTGELTRPMSTNIPDLPVEEKKRLVADLSAVLTSTQESPDSLDWDFRQKTRRKETISDEEFGLQIRVSFVRFFCRILYDYHKYIVFLRVFGQGKKGPTLMFDKNGFISSRAQNSSDERFWKRITSSQGFSVFVNDYSRPRYEVFSECLAKDIREMNVADIAEMIAPREPVEVEGITISLDLDDSDDDDDDNDNEDTVEVSPEGVFGAVVQPPPTLAQEQERSDFAFVSDELDWNRVKPVSISESARRTIIRFIDLMAVGGGKVVDESIIPQITETLKSQKCLIVFSRELTNKDLLKVNNGKLDEMEFGILGDVCKSALTESQKTNDTEVAENIFEFSTTYYKILEGAEEFLTVTTTTIIITTNMLTFFFNR